MTSVTQCLECGANISEDAKGLCVKCMLKLGLASQLSGGSIQSSVRPPIPGSTANGFSGQAMIEPFEFGGYRIFRLLGKGGMGAVYEAEDLASGRRVALKVLGHSLDSPDTRKRFIREGRLAASINHPNTVYVYGTEEIDGAPVITMELVQGGTLQDLVKSGGPLPIAHAVDSVLQIIAGLEAAHAVGILHRDIKPANCFIDPDGTVKVGDFGLSISTLSRGESALTLAGSFLGTPEFSSPEQLRGEELTVRSDIYSVGMTLYYLLTGKTPFHADNVVQLLATVLEKPAASPRNVRPEIPDALARIVLRCLAKQAGDRFASYDELRRVLLPYNSTSPTPATLGLRFAAGVIDQIVIGSFNTLITVVLFPDLIAYADPGISDPSSALWIGSGILSVHLAYFAVPEGLWGASAGKALMGLRVARIDRSAPGVPKALLRVFIYILPTLASFLLQFFGDWSSWDLPTWNKVVGAAAFLYMIALFSTARRRNGFAGLHDLLTKTRVIQRSAYQPRPAVILAEEPVAATEALPKRGPYHVLATLSATENDAVVLGYDTKLLRRVWIRERSTGAAPVAAALRSVARPGRLRWLQGNRTETDAWDAYEAIPGTPFVNLLQNPQPWKSVRYWLLDVATELAASSRDGSLPPLLSLNCVWINGDGRAKLLDFPAPGADAEPTAQRVEPVDTSRPDAPQIFLNQLAISALEGGAASVEEARTRAPAVPLPCKARNFLQGLRATADFAPLIEGLKSLVLETPYVSRRRRLGLVAGCTLPAVIFAAAMFAGTTFLQRWQNNNPEFDRLRRSLSRHNEYREGTTARSMEIYIAGHFGDFIRDRQKWNAQLPKTIPPKWRQDAERIVAAHPHPTAEEMQRAHAELAPMLDEHGHFKSRRQTSTAERKIEERMPYALFAGTLGFTAAFSLLCALAFRGGLLLRLLGIGVVTRTGADATRLRMLWRAFIAWSPLLLAAFVVAILGYAMPLPAAIASAALVVIVPVIISAVLRERSLQDRLADTWLVPR